MPADRSDDGKHGIPTAETNSAVPPPLRNGFAGAVSGAVSRVLTAPFDVAKIRCQLDHGATARYDKSLWSAMKSIHAEEGFISLWRGTSAAMSLWAVYAGVQFSTYERLRSMDLLNTNAAEVKPAPSGSIPRGEGTRLEARTRYGGAATAAAEENGNEGYGVGRGQKGTEESNCSDGGYRVGHSPKGGSGSGTGSTMVESGSELPQATAHFLYGAISGSAATVASYPFDITRTALASQGVPKRYDSGFAFVIHTLREAGPGGFFRGMSTALTMIAPQMGVAFAVYERLRRSRPHPSSFSGKNRTSARTGVPDLSHAIPGESGRAGADVGERRRTAAHRGDCVGRDRLDAEGLEGRGADNGNGNVSGSSSSSKSSGGGNSSSSTASMGASMGASGFHAARRNEAGRTNKALSGWSRQGKAGVRVPGGDLGGVGSSRGSDVADDWWGRWGETAWPLVAGAMAGMISKAVVFPLDTVKKRVQTEVMLQRDVAYGVLPKYSGPVDAFSTIVQSEGRRALFRGIVPGMWKSGLSTALTFAVYEWVKAGTNFD